MASPEHEQPSHAAESTPENEREPYYHAARFPNEKVAGKAYFRVQRTIFERPGSDLSVYRFQLAGVYHVAVVGDPPMREMERRLRNILSTGIPTTLPSDILTMLQERRAQAIQVGPWVEGHYRGDRL